MKYINDFEVKTIEENYDIEITSISLKDKEDIYDGVYINYVYNEIPLHVWLEIYETKEERIKEAIRQMLEEAKAYKKISSMPYEIDFFDYISDAVIQLSNLKNSEPLLVKAIEKLGVYTFKISLKKYIEDYVKSNKKITNGDVYRHCIQDLNKDWLKEISR